jgi:beta-lactamase regulating signal transducer with metallopeptidase domain
METTWESLNQKQQNELQQLESEPEVKNQPASSVESSSNLKTERASSTSVLGSILNIVAVIGLVIGVIIFVDLFFNYGKLLIEVLLFSSESLMNGNRMTY